MKDLLYIDLNIRLCVKFNPRVDFPGLESSIQVKTWGNFGFMGYRKSQEFPNGPETGISTRSLTGPNRRRQKKTWKHLFFWTNVRNQTLSVSSCSAVFWVKDFAFVFKFGCSHPIVSTSSWTRLSVKKSLRAHRNYLWNMSERLRTLQEHQKPTSMSDHIGN